MDVEIKVFELYKQVQKLCDRLDDIETYEKSDFYGPEHLVVEEIHWFLKFATVFFCYA